ncbi:MAG: hypothetical protein IJX37_02585, partial [Oscillospiraceae bacterium]|nr:hypothetical protein [Oscillospiraceae bacterium]
MAISAMLLLILDPQTAKTGASEGIELCIRVIIPSLFPFFIVTSFLNTSLLGLRIPLLHILSKQLQIPDGGESVLVLGLMGGYPVGAQLVCDVYAEKRLSKRDCQILLGYCSNAGPAFIFGVTGMLFKAHWVPFVLWGIHILSALITGWLLPRPHSTAIDLRGAPGASIVSALRKSIHICASVCGWVTIFKIILAYLNQWLRNDLRNEIMICIAGFLELTNGCLQLEQIDSEAARFILCTAFLSFGGICVLLQTASVTRELGYGLYIPGKIMQTA